MIRLPKALVPAYNQAPKAKGFVSQMVCEGDLYQRFYNPQKQKLTIVHLHKNGFDKEIKCANLTGTGLQPDSSLIPEYLIEKTVNIFKLRGKEQLLYPKQSARMEILDKKKPQGQQIIDYVLPTNGYEWVKVAQY